MSEDVKNAPKLPSLKNFVRGLRNAGSPYIRLPPAVQHVLRSCLTRATRFDVADASSLKPGLSLIGYPRAEFGLGEALRLLALAAQQTALPFAAFDIDNGIWARQGDRRLEGHISRRLDRRVNLVIHNPQFAGQAIRLLGSKAFAGRHNILYAFWELPEIPDRWLSSLSSFDEIWVPSRFVETAIRAKYTGPVFRLPTPMDIPQATPGRRSAFGLPAERFLFYFSFDFSSFAARKNPDAVVAAFRACAAALPAGRVGLVLKTMGESNGGADRRRLARLVDGADDIFVLDRVLDRPALRDLQASCDCFVSLHRSEGFGLCIAEAMALGKPVIATNFGGPADLLRREHACLVDYRMVPVAESQYPGHCNQYWAEPDVQQAAAHMRQVYEQPEWGHELGAAGRRFIHGNLSPRRIGIDMRRRLGEIVSGPFE